MALITGGKKLGGFQFGCPGCKTEHYVRVFPKNGKHPIWTWNESWESPTFSPSVKHFYTDPGEHEGDPKVDVVTCHYFVTDGVIRYCGDSPHEFGGKNVRMIDLESFKTGHYEVEIVADEPVPQPTLDQIQAARARRDGRTAVAPAPVPQQPRTPAPPPPEGLRLWTPRPKARPEVLARFSPHARRT